MSLPRSWVDRLFEKLTLVYGRDFLDRWRDLDMDAVKADWAHELAGFKDHPEMLQYALQHLPAGFPPTVLQFREIARKCPPPKFQPLPAPAVDPAKVRELLDGVRRRMTRFTAAS